MPVKTTYYSDEEMARLEDIADQRDESFSKVVREAIQDHYNL